jgi:hypothetical protein
MAYIGRDIQYGVLDKQSFTTNGSTTVFTLDSGVKDAKSLLVSVGGIIQEPDVAYTASGTTLTFTAAPANGLVAYAIFLGKTLESGGTRDQITFQSETGDATTTPFTLSATPANAQSIMVTLNGVTQVPNTDYTVNGTTITFTVAPANGMGILVYHLGSAAAIGTINDASVTDAKIVGMSASKLSGSLGANTVANTSIVSLDASKLTGTLPGSMAVDTTALDQTIASLGMHVAVADNKVSFNLPGVFIDQFESDSGILTETTVDRDTTGEYVSSIYSADTVTTPGSGDWTEYTSAYTITSGGVDNITGDDGIKSVWTSGTGDFTIQFTATGVHNQAWGFYPVTEDSTWAGVAYGGMDNMTVSYWFTGNSAANRTYAQYSSFGTARVMSAGVNAGDVVKYTRISGQVKVYINSSLVYTYPETSNVDMRFTFTNHGTPFDGDIDSLTFTASTPTTSATGTLISTASTADSATTTASGVMVYENSSGTATLGTDLKAYFSADDGANWTEASSYGSAINFNGASKKMVKLGKTTGLTSGTQMKLKAEWANQASSTSTQALIAQGTGTIIGDFTTNVSNAFNSTISTRANSAQHQNGQSLSNVYIGKDLGAGNEKIITGASWARPTDADSIDSQATLTAYLYASNSAPTSYNDGTLLGTIGTETNNTSTSQMSKLDFSNSTTYRYVWIHADSAGTNNNFWCAEAEFYETPVVAGKETRLHGWAVNY